jgi:hypothetical protein
MPVVEGVLAELLRVIDPSVRSGHILAQNIIKCSQTVLVHGIG